MTLSERAALMEEILNSELLPVQQAKGHDYAGEDDCMSNLKDFGWQGVVVRMGDKYHRLKNFVLQEELKVSDETIEDTLKDLLNYTFFALILKRREIPVIRKSNLSGVIGKKAE